MDYQKDLEGFSLDPRKSFQLKNKSPIYSDKLFKFNNGDSDKNKRQFSEPMVQHNFSLNSKNVNNKKIFSLKKSHEQSSRSKSSKKFNNPTDEAMIILDSKILSRTQRITAKNKAIMNEKLKSSKNATFSSKFQNPDFILGGNLSYKNNSKQSLKSKESLKGSQSSKGSNIKNRKIDTTSNKAVNLNLKSSKDQNILTQHSPNDRPSKELPSNENFPVAERKESNLGKIKILDKISGIKTFLRDKKKNPEKKYSPLENLNNSPSIIDKPTPSTVNFKSGQFKNNFNTKSPDYIINQDIEKYSLKPPFLRPEYSFSSKVSKVLGADFKIQNKSSKIIKDSTSSIGNKNNNSENSLVQSLNDSFYNKSTTKFSWYDNFEDTLDIISEHSSTNSGARKDSTMDYQSCHNLKTDLNKDESANTFEILEKIYLNRSLSINRVIDVKAKTSESIKTQDNQTSSSEEEESSSSYKNPLDSLSTDNSSQLELNKYSIEHSAKMKEDKQSLTNDQKLAMISWELSSDTNSSLNSPDFKYETFESFTQFTDPKTSINYEKRSQNDSMLLDKNLKSETTNSKFLSLTSVNDLSYNDSNNSPFNKKTSSISLNNEKYINIDNDIKVNQKNNPLEYQNVQIGNENIKLRARNTYSAGEKIPRNVSKITRVHSWNIKQSELNIEGARHSRLLLRKMKTRSINSAGNSREFEWAYNMVLNENKRASRLIQKDNDIKKNNEFKYSQIYSADPFTSESSLNNNSIFNFVDKSYEQFKNTIEVDKLQQINTNDNQLNADLNHTLNSMRKSQGSINLKSDKTEKEKNPDAVGESDFSDEIKDSSYSRVNSFLRDSRELSDIVREIEDIKKKNIKNEVAEDSDSSEIFNSVNSRRLSIDISNDFNETGSETKIDDINGLLPSVNYDINEIKSIGSAKDIGSDKYQMISEEINKEYVTSRAKNTSFINQEIDDYDERLNEFFSTEEILENNNGSDMLKHNVRLLLALYSKNIYDRSLDKNKAIEAKKIGMNQTDNIWFKKKKSKFFKKNNTNQFKPNEIKCQGGDDDQFSDNDFTGSSQQILAKKNSKKINLNLSDSNISSSNSSYKSDVAGENTENIAYLSEYDEDYSDSDINEYLFETSFMVAKNFLIDKIETFCTFDLYQNYLKVLNDFVINDAYQFYLDSEPSDSDYNSERLSLISMLKLKKTSSGNFESNINEDNKKKLHSAHLESSKNSYKISESVDINAKLENMDCDTETFSENNDSSSSYPGSNTKASKQKTTRNVMFNDMKIITIYVYEKYIDDELIENLDSLDINTSDFFDE
ncbi:hypothetical protein BB561_002726 [Smittium simulii]|uniref:Uncharacterized protein n=1 Tax=Smittium simulii TaxID=133385 RepID=A0A2T9YPN6_9FUNG|nr:hypothetical protein BB561_002726 [Smittium simulii]